MEEFKKVRKKLNRHVRYVYSKDSKRRLEYYGLAPKEPSAETVTMTIAELTEIKFALQSLSDLELMIVQRNIIGKETLEVIAKRLNLSLASVKRKKKAALYKLKEYLK